MKYMGSKNRIAKEILPLILKNRKENQYYIEPFVGGANVIDKVDGLRIGLDVNKYLIALFKGLQNNEDLILDIPKELYNKARDQFNLETQNIKIENKEFNDFQLGWIGYMGSANGRFFDGGYSGISKTSNGGTRNYIEESIKNILKQKNNLNGINFFHSSYENFNYPKNSIIYCDIPYQNTKQYKFSRDFNYDKFWDWARAMKKNEHEIYISEYNAPDDFICVWEKEVKSSLSANGINGGNKNSIEKLFTI